MNIQLIVIFALFRIDSVNKTNDSNVELDCQPFLAEEYVCWKKQNFEYQSISETQKIW